MEFQDLDTKLVDVKLAGRLDTPGVDRIELRLTAKLVPNGRNAVIDLSEVQLVTSMGIRLFITLARSLRTKQAKLALYSPQVLVNETFTNAALADILPICQTQADAMDAVRAS
jgi:anti-sigma B factor antagonist/stage II sporulation protein AA (anti-sigma F factor antagonist)